jgi:hypothetical protein
MAGYLGNIPSAVPLTSADIADGIITSAKIADGTIVNADINASSAIAISKISATGTSLQSLRMNSGATALEFATVTGTVFGSALLHVIDEKPTQTQGGSLSDGTNNVRTLNTVKTNEISGASLATNSITLPSGTYHLQAQALNYKTASARLTWRNTTDSSDTIIGMMSYQNNANGASTYNFISGRFTISAQKVFQLQHRVQTTDANGAGYQDDGLDSKSCIYCDVKIWKIA